MKNIIKVALITLFAMMGYFSYGQRTGRQVMTLRCNLSQNGSGGSGPTAYWQLTGNANDQGGTFTVDNIQEGDYVLFNDSGVNFILPIDTIISATEPSFTVRVLRNGITQISSVPTTNSAAITRGSPNYDLVGYTAGITDADQQLNFEDFLYTVDSLIANNVQLTTVSTDATLDGSISNDTLYLNTVLSGIQDTTYVVSISGGNAGSYLTVTAETTGVTASYSTGVYTITFPANVDVKSVHLIIVSADVQSGSDGAVTDWVRVVFEGTKGNTNMTNIRVPHVQKINYPTSNPLSVTNAGSMDFDNNPLVAPVGNGSNSITIRVSGLSIGGQGYGLTFSDF